MRYYAIKLTSPTGDFLYVPPSLGTAQLDGGIGGASFASYTNGKNVPGAWDVEFDIPVIDAATSQGFATARVWGISVAEIAQANNLAGNLSQDQPPFNISIYGGMKQGLPLANPAQAGLLLHGTVFQCFGNWIDTDQTLDFVIMPGPPATSSNVGGIGTLANPKNLNFNWPAGQPMATMIKNTLANAYPGSTSTINISADLVRPAPDQGTPPTLEQFAQYCRRQSFDIVKTPNYQGVSIIPSGNSFLVYDGTVAATAAAKQINFQDMIGQPTWIDAPLISLKTVMRADLAVGSNIKLPPALITNTAAASSSLVNQKAAFQGTFSIVSLRHIGHFRQPSADSWVTVIEAVPNAAS